MFFPYRDDNPRRHDLVIRLLRENNVIDKPVADGTMSKCRLREYLQYVADDEASIIERCQAIWA